MVVVFADLQIAFDTVVTPEEPLRVFQANHFPVFKVWIGRKIYRANMV